MSNDDTPSQDNANKQPAKGRQPDFIVQTPTGDKDNSHWTKIGAAWKNDKGYITAELAALPTNGKIIFQPREELERLREQKQQPAPTQQQKPVTEPSQQG
jgi:hypothetical protein